MNQLDARMRQIQATQDPVLRQRRMEEFLKTLQGGKWNDRHYMMVKTADRKAQAPANDTQKKKPRIFDIGK